MPANPEETATRPTPPSADRYRRLVEGIEEYAVIFLDKNGLINGWNAGAHAIFAHEADDVFGRHFELIFFPDDVSNGVPGAELTRALESGKAVDERWHIRKDGTQLWASGFTVPVYSPEGLHEGFAKIAQDATTRKKEQVERETLLAETEAAHLEADTANNFKDEFINQLAHELRSPVDAILLWTLLLRSQDLDEAETRRGLNAIERGATSIQNLLDDLLDSVRGQTGKIALDLGTLDLGQLVAHTVDDFRPAAAARELILDFSAPPEPLLLNGDGGRLRQVIANLLANAIKFTQPGGHIQVLVSGSGAAIEFAVRDNGRGFDPATTESLFEPYRQEKRAGDTPSGLGLGLFIVKSLVELHGGQVHASSPGPDQGAEFVVTLPGLNAPQ